MAVYYVYISLILGVISWILPIIAIKKSTKNNIHFYTIPSFTAAMFSLVFQMLEIKHRVDISDWSALMDTMGAIVSISVVLILVTAVLNFFALTLCKDK